MPTPLHKSESPDGRVLVRVGMCPPHCPRRPDVSRHVEALLAKEGIQAIIHGSRAYAIEILESNALRAIELLRADPQKKDYGITVFEV